MIFIYILAKDLIIFCILGKFDLIGKYICMRNKCSAYCRVLIWMNEFPFGVGNCGFRKITVSLFISLNHGSDHKSWSNWPYIIPLHCIPNSIITN